MSSRPRYNLLKLSEARNWHPEIKNLITVIQKYGNPYSKIVIAINQNVWLLPFLIVLWFVHAVISCQVISWHEISPRTSDFCVNDPNFFRLGSPFLFRTVRLLKIGLRYFWVRDSWVLEISSQTFWFMAITIFE